MKWSIEEEEDRKRVQMTRRRFLFLGAAAAGAAITKKLMPEIGLPPTYRTYLAGADAIVSTPGLHTATGVEAMRVYYTKSFLKTLKAGTPFARCTTRRELPGKELRLFMYNPLRIQGT
jgi:hypothetical protein